MRKKIFVILLSIDILYGCGNRTTVDIETEPTAVPQITTQPKETLAPTTILEPTATPEVEHNALPRHSDSAIFPMLTVQISTAMASPSLLPTANTVTVRKESLFIVFMTV